MDLFQCVMPPRKGDDSHDQGDEYRQTRSVDRDVLHRQHRGSRRSFRERRPSLPSEHVYNFYPAMRAARSRDRQVSSNSGQSSSGGGLKHWGSSLSLHSDVSVNDLTKRTLQPPTPSTLRRARTPTPSTAPEKRQPTKPKYLPLTSRTPMDHPELADYLEKPRLVSTLGLGAVRPWSPPVKDRQSYAPDQWPPFRNLRLGGFMEGQNVSDGEVIPEMLRQYYYDTFLQDFNTKSEGFVPQRQPFHRGM